MVGQQLSYSGQIKPRLTTILHFNPSVQQLLVQSCIVDI